VNNIRLAILSARRKLAYPSKSLLLIPILLAFFAAGASGKFIHSGPNYPPYPGQVVILLEPPEGINFEELGLVTSSGGMMHHWDDLVEAMQKEAARHGANAIIIRSSAETGSSIPPDQQVERHEGTYPRRDVIGVAIRISDHILTEGRQAGSLRAAP
jgi:hypothetical protein